MAPSKESGALAELFIQLGAAMSPDDPLISRCVYDQVSRAGAECPGVTYEDTLLPNKLPCKWVRPEKASNKHVILYMHGGGYTFGSPNGHRKLAAHLARACNAPSLMVDYRMAPEHVYPAALDDCVAAYQWLLEHGFEAKNIVVAGDSCGGGLSATVPLAAIKRGLPTPGAAVSLSPWYDFTFNSPSMTENEQNDVLGTMPFMQMLARRYAGDASYEDPLISAMFAENLHEIPPTWISCAGHDMLRDDGRRFAEKAKRAGADVVVEVHEGQQHVFEFMVGKAPEADQSITKIGEWVRGKIGS